MRELKGTHGTCVTYAEKIVKTGDWSPSNNGRAGSGVYLWGYTSSRKNARSLAIGWWQRSSNTNKYKGVDNSNGAVLYASIRVKEEAFFDSTQLDFQDALCDAIEIADQASGFSCIDEEIICKIYERLILDVENVIEQKFDVIQARVPSPPKMPFRQKIVVGNPISYVVRSGSEKIEILELEKL